MIGELARRPWPLAGASVAIDRPLVESSLQPHVRRVRFTNGYRETVTGTMRLRPPRGWTVNPPVPRNPIRPALAMRTTRATEATPLNTPADLEAFAKSL